MFNYIVYIVLLFIFSKLYKNRDKISFMYNIYRTYKNSFDPEGKIGHFNFIFSLCYTVVSYYPLKYMHKINLPEKFNRKYIKISYKFNDKIYFYLLKVPRGVTPLKSIEDENGKDISDVISPYLGPNLDCHGISIYPKDFGYKSIKIETIFDKVILFEENDQINLVE